MSYKNILWIDDCDDGDSGFEADFLKFEKGGYAVEGNLEIIKSYFPQHYDSVRLITDFNEALDVLKVENTQFDLVVFDINFKNGIDSDDFSSIKKRLIEKRVDIENVGYPEFTEQAGLYLYLYLLNCGYPNDRMVILTGYDENTPEKFLEKAHITLAVDEKKFIFQKESGEISSKYKNWVCTFYYEEYYQVRRLVFKSCEYWKEKLENKSLDYIAFNEIYYKSGGKQESGRIVEDSFINMIERIEMLFPVAVPGNCEAVYYQALQVATMFHEESAKIDYAKKYDQIIQYHQAVRNFRNWSAHNQFTEIKIPAKLFGYLYCATMRTYFKAPVEEQFSSVLFPYEEEYFESEKEKHIDDLSIRGKYKGAFHRHFKKVFNDSEKKRLKYQDINELLLESGKCKCDSLNKMQFTDLLLNIIDYWIVPLDQCPEKIEQTNNGILSYTVKYDWNKKLKDKKMEDIVSYEKDTYKSLAYYLFGKFCNIES